MNTLSLLKRKELLFEEDTSSYEIQFRDLLSGSRVLVIGGAGTIGQATSKEIFKRDPAALHIVDISENNMVELVRDIRSTLGYGSGDFRTFAIDCGSKEFEALIEVEGPYDYIFNLSALKHVRSEKDPFTLMRMLDVNIFNTIKTIRIAKAMKSKNYFCVSTDKAANPVNMMGASKRIMEMFLMRESLEQNMSMARFANVAFSDGSLLHGFNQRLSKHQPISAPNDVTRYFVTPQESGELCLMSGLLGENRDIFFPKLNKGLHLISFADIAVKYLRDKGFEPYLCDTEDQARELVKTLPKQGKWPCLFTKSDTTGEKDFEEFYTDREVIDMDKFENLGVIKNEPEFNGDKLNQFENAINQLKSSLLWTKQQIVDQFFIMIPGFGYKDKGKYLDSKM